ncbi:CO dehydrogenase maturation factor [Thermocatellispora tengchongensis]|uniref:CO dehydrogenase maturation factor n=1 Tax=Thermocatellispora tengchongensis TaxID=1073253 RepID=A0A840NPD5_9ACTN|nr:ATP-binding protein [Thermocatellispora tengchongensis]MBB5130384.1 CO dehydrogenase maturation factor [Thermocatellispora tengchongensis]
MRVAFVGKGGSGKTTLSALFSRYVAARGGPVIAVDADINQHLGMILGVDEDDLPAAMGAHLREIKEYLRGSNPRIASAEAMVKTTPPGRGSRLLRLGEATDEIHRRFAVTTPEGPGLMVTGPFDEDDLGVACYHSKVGAVELYLNHLVDGPGEYVVVDMTAGADSFASGLFTRFDLTYLVAEPTRQGVSVYRQYRDYAAEFGVRIAVVGNKVQGPEDVEFLRSHVGADLLTWFEHSRSVRALEQGRAFRLDDLEPANLDALALLLKHLDAQEKDWERFGRQAVEFHLRNAAAWANRATGQDLAAQVDPEFVFGPAALGSHPDAGSHADAGSHPDAGSHADVASAPMEPAASLA